MSKDSGHAAAQAALDREDDLAELRKVKSLADREQSALEEVARLKRELEQAKRKAREAALAFRCELRRMTRGAK